MQKIEITRFGGRPYYLKQKEAGDNSYWEVYKDNSILGYYTLRKKAEKRIWDVVKKDEELAKKKELSEADVERFLSQDLGDEKPKSEAERALEW